MSSEIFYPAVSNDDGYWWIEGTDPSDLADWDTELLFGDYASGDSYAIWIRFPNITIPTGVVITSATIKFTAYSSLSSTVCNANCYFNNVDNADTIPTTPSEANALAVTAAVAWSAIPAWTDGIQYDTPELKTILQTIVDRGGWSSGNAVMAIIKNNGSDGWAKREASAIDYLSGAEKPELHITWIVADTGEISEEINVLSEFDTNLSEITENVNALSEFDDNFGVLLEDVSVSSEFNNNLGELNENIGVSSVFERFVADVVFNENASVNTSLIAEYTGELSEEASVNSEFVCYQQPANINAELPMITADILGGQGGFLDATLPCITADIKGGAQLDVTLPCITASIEGKAGIVGSLNVTLPMVTANIEGKVETLGDIDVTLPMIRAYITGKTGEVGSINVTLPMVEASLSGYQDISGDINVTLPLINPCLVGTVDRFDCTPLRYVEPI